LKTESLFIYNAPDTKMRLLGQVRHTCAPTGEKDRLDVGVLRLDSRTSPPYAEVEKHALPISALWGNALPRIAKRYLVLGFPGSKSKPNDFRGSIESKPYANLCPSIAAECYRKLGFGEETHILMEFNRKRVHGSNGRSQTFPHPAGMSGSPVWVLIDNTGPNDPKQTPVAGILIEYHKHHNVLVRTDVDVALKLINHAF
jgi:hypothetical protein